jgi:hypothetical protein
VRIEFDRAGAPGLVEVEVGVNERPAELGCPDYARGFPCCRATVSPAARGYADFLGWVQLADSDLHRGGFHLDYFEPLGPVPHPFAFYGFAPTLFDAPHSDDENWCFLVHSFLCGLGTGALDGRNEIDAVLGFSWGFQKSGGEIRIDGPSLLSPSDWDRHHAYLRAAYPAWSFLSGFSGSPRVDG